MSIIVNSNNHMNNNVNNDSEHTLIDWNLQYNIPLRDTLAGIQRIDLYDYFQAWFTTCYGKPC